MVDAMQYHGGPLPTRVCCTEPSRPQPNRAVRAADRELGGQQRTT
jgi:hypothetical protein